MSVFKKMAGWFHKPDKISYKHLDGSNSELVKMFALDESLTENDLINVSHKNKEGVYVTKIVKLGELRRFLITSKA